MPECGRCAIAISTTPSPASNFWWIPEPRAPMSQPNRSRLSLAFLVFLVLLVSFAILLVFTLPMEAQVSSGSLLGDVRDEKGATVAGVSIQVANKDTGFTRSATTNEYGSYRIDDLLPGSYAVFARHSGFESVTMSPVFIEVNKKSRLDFDLHVGESHETVTVTAHASPLETE